MQNFQFSSDVDWNWLLIRKFIKRIEISVNIRNFTKWIEISVNILDFPKWIQISLIIRIVRIKISLTNLRQLHFKTVWSYIHWSNIFLIFGWITRSFAGRSKTIWMQLRSFAHFCIKFPVISPRRRTVPIKKVMAKKHRKYDFS